MPLFIVVCGDFWVIVILCHQYEKATTIFIDASSFTSGQCRGC